MPRPTTDPESMRREIIRLQGQIRDLRTRNVDLHGRRFVKAGDAVSQGDFITKAELDAAIENNRIQIGNLERRLSRIRISSGGGSEPDPSGGLPPPNHPMDFGYYKVETEKYGYLLSQVKDYTNLVYIDPFDHGTSADAPSTYLANMAFNMAKVKNAGLNMMLDMSLGEIWTKGNILIAATPYWDKVKYLILGDELDMSAAAMDNEVQLLMNNLNNLGLSQKPIGVTLTPATTMTTDAIFSTKLHFVNIEAYTADPPNHGSSQDNINAVQVTMSQMIARIPATKKLTVVMQAYDRNGCFRPIVPDLVDLQRATYLMVHQNTRVDAIVMFSYGREGIAATSPCPDNGDYGGTKFHPELIPEHRAIWGAINGGTGSGGGGGPVTNPGATRCGQGRACCGGVQNEEECPRWCDGGDYKAQVGGAVQSFIATAPVGVMDPSDPLRRILDIPAFMLGVVDRFNTDNPTLIAQVDPGHDGKEIQVRSRTNAVFSEQWSLWAGDQEVRSFEGNPPGSYRATCYPPRF